MAENLALGGQGGTAPTLLMDPHRLESDLNLLRRAVVEEWPVKPEDRPAIINRLRAIVAKALVEVPSKDGTVTVDGPADRNAIAAAAVLKAMVGDNISDRHHVERLRHAPKGAVNVTTIGQVHIVYNVPDSVREAI